MKMNGIFKIMVMLATFSLVSCSDEDDLKPSESLGIPEMFSPAADADARVKEMYNDYGLWVRMDFTDWHEVTNAYLYEDVNNRMGATMIDDTCRENAIIFSQTLLSNVSKEFAKAIQKTDNYYVIVTRESLPALPYSAEEIYGIRTSGKYGTLKQSYHEFYRIYGTDTWTNPVKPEMVLTEDSNSGYQFFSHICQANGLKCESMNGKSNVFHYINEHKDQKILVIADGAAFGSEIDRVLKLIRENETAALYLPESFEWLILKSGVLKNNQIDQMLDEPAEYIESREYFSWERFFTSVLIENTRDSYLAYAKKKLNEAYLGGMIEDAILKQMEKIELGWKKEIQENKEEKEPIEEDDDVNSEEDEKAQMENLLDNLEQ